MIFPPPRGHARPIVQLYPPRSYEAEAVDYVLRVRAAGSDVSAANARAVNTLIRGLKVGGLWPALKACCLLAGPDTLAGALVPLAASMPPPTNFNFVSSDYARTTGLKGDAAGKYLATNRAHDAEPQNSRHLAVWVTTPATNAATFSFVEGGSVASSSLSRNPVEFGTGSYFSRMSSSDVAIRAGVSGAGFLGSVRSSAASISLRLRGDVATIAAVSAAPSVGSFNVFRRTAAVYTDARLAFYSIGEAIDLAALDALVAAYVAALV